jgi:hypothetical protein
VSSRAGVGGWYGTRLSERGCVVVVECLGLQLELRRPESRTTSWKSSLLAAVANQELKSIFMVGGVGYCSQVGRLLVWLFPAAQNKAA